MSKDMSDESGMAGEAVGKGHCINHMQQAAHVQ